jgi:anaerobic selenocysteine-containing dehydrogenase
MRDETLQHPRCVWNLLQHVSRYTPEVVENICGTPKADFLKVCEVLASTSARTEPPSCTRWAGRSIPSGAEHPHHGDDQLLLGNMRGWRRVNALRGHSNIQG